MKITLDWNCIIEVEERRLQSTSVERLVELHRAGQINVGLLAASASENNKSKRLPGNAKFFKERVAALGWSDLPIVPMPAVWGLSYWDFSFWTENSREFERDFDAIWRTIAPSVDRDPSVHLDVKAKEAVGDFQSEKLSRWRNTWCDVMSAYCHIYANRDVFVTLNTKDFQRNRQSLADLGMRTITTPEECLELVS